MQKDTTVVSSFKIWLFPTMVSIIGVLIWQEISEIKSDVKALLAQSNIDKTRIDNLERVLYNKPVSKSENPTAPIDPIVSIIPVFMPIKEEDLYKLTEEQA